MKKVHSLFFPLLSAQFTVTFHNIINRTVTFFCHVEDATTYFSTAT